jgi:hypothetical protein
MRKLLGLVVLLGVSATAATIVVPPANAGVEGTGAADIGAFFLGGNSWTTQFFIPSSMLSGIPNGSQITGLGVRLDSSASTGPSSTLNFSNFDLTLSVPSATYSSNLGTTFASNIGADATLVRSGALSIAANSYPGGGSPNAFGPLIVFTNPYSYNGGDLLITLRNSGSGGADLVIDATANFLGMEMYGGAANDATTGNSSIARAPVFELQYGAASTVPEPATVSLVLAGAIGLITLRRRRS